MLTTMKNDDGAWREASVACPFMFCICCLYCLCLLMIVIVIVIVILINIIMTMHGGGSGQHVVEGRPIHAATAGKRSGCQPPSQGVHNLCMFVLLCICTFMLLNSCVCVFQYVCTFVLFYVCVCVRENGLVANKGKGLQPRGTPCDALPADLCHPCLPPALVCPFHPKDNARCYTVPYQTKPN